jgi:outer membrane protein TolC
MIINGAKAETVLTADKVRQLAIEHNRQYLSARQEIDRAQGDIISARSGAFPQLSFSGRYTRNFKPREFFFGDQKIPISMDNDFDFALSLSQPLYVGGKVGSALDIAKVYSKYTSEKVREVESQIVFGAESMFYAASLSQSNQDVLQKAYDQLSYNLEMVEKYFGQGLISEYELLRARVEKANLEPQLIAAQSEVTMAEKRLKSFLGLSLDEKIIIDVNQGDTAGYQLLPLDSLITVALKNRPEIKQAEYQKCGYDKAVRIAKGDWLFPVVSLNTTYEFTASSNDFALTGREISKTWNASLILSIPLFDGGRTIGEVRKAKVKYYQAVLEEQQTYDNIRLEVEQAYDNMNMAQKALEIQKETIAQAEEGMRIANLRYKSGVGTQIEVLSAQTALTDARTNMSRSVYNYRLAKSGMKKALGIDINQ